MISPASHRSESVRSAAGTFSRRRLFTFARNRRRTSKPCKFKLSKIILQRSIGHDQVKELLEHRKTDLLEQFISKAGKPFSAYLVMDDAGKVTFEFPPREDEAPVE